MVGLVGAGVGLGAVVVTNSVGVGVARGVAVGVAVGATATGADPQAARTIASSTTTCLVMDRGYG